MLTFYICSGPFYYTSVSAVLYGSAIKTNDSVALASIYNNYRNIRFSCLLLELKRLSYFLSVSLFSATLNIDQSLQFLKACDFSLVPLQSHPYQFFVYF